MVNPPKDFRHKTLVVGDGQQVAKNDQKEVVEPFFNNPMTIMQNNNDAPGMKGYRSRNEKGPLRAKLGDTQIGTIEKRYDLDLNVRSDMRLDTFLKQKDIKSLNDLINGK